MFGVVLLNDWSARDIQAWEYQPLGPFLAKSFATTISPWIVTLEALAPFRCAARAPPTTPSRCPISGTRISAKAAFDIEVEMHLKTRKMRAPVRLSHGNFRDSYWTVAQMVAHHTSNGCNLRPGDLLGSGTISGATPDSYGSMMELTQARQEAAHAAGRRDARFVPGWDGDEATAARSAVRIGFGEAAGAIRP